MVLDIRSSTARHEAWRKLKTEQRAHFQNGTLILPGLHGSVREMELLRRGFPVPVRPEQWAWKPITTPVLHVAASEETTPSRPPVPGRTWFRSETGIRDS